MTEFKVPELGENVASGDVARVLVNVGDTIAKEQAVVELETDKATIEVPSSVAGKVSEIRVKKGDKVKVGAVVLVVEDAAAAQGAGNGGAPAAGAKPAEEEAKSAEPAKAAAQAPAEKPAAETAKPEKVVAMPSRAEAPAKIEPAKAAPQAA